MLPSLVLKKIPEGSGIECVVGISWNEKFEMDVWYVDNQSFSLDIKILFLTLIKVIKRDGISHNNHATMEKFKGN